MTTYQTSANFLVALKREVTLGTAPGAAGGTGLRIIASPGLKLARGRIQSAELRDDGVRAPGRLGGKSVSGSYNAEASAGGGNDILLEAVMRGTWSASSALTTATGVGACVDLTAATTSTITRTGSGSFVTDGWMVGDVARLASYSTAADNDINLFVKSVAAATLTFFGTPLTVGAADTACTLTRLKKVVTPASPVRVSHYVEQYYEDIDISECFSGCRVTGLKITAQPKQPVQLAWTMMGLDRTALASAASPYYTTPAFTTGQTFVIDDAVVAYDGGTVANLTGFDLDLTIAAKGVDMIGSLTSPDIFDNILAVEGTISGLAADFAQVTKFDAETEFEFGAMMAVPGTAPVDTWSLYGSRLMFTELDRSQLSGDGAQIVTAKVEVKPKVAASGYDATPLSFCSTGA